MVFDPASVGGWSSDHELTASLDNKGGYKLVDTKKTTCKFVYARKSDGFDIGDFCGKPCDSTGANAGYCGAPHKFQMEKRKSKPQKKCRCVWMIKTGSRVKDNGGKPIKCGKPVVEGKQWCKHHVTKGEALDEEDDKYTLQVTVKEGDKIELSYKDWIDVLDV